MRGTPEYDALVPRLDKIPGARQIVCLAVDLVQASCGMGVPLFDYREDRLHLVRHWERQGPERLRDYCTAATQAAPKAAKPWSVQDNACGAAITFGARRIAAPATGGSGSNTSRPAPASRPSASAAASAASSTIGPRAVLMRNAVGFISARRPAETKPRVS